MDFSFRSRALQHGGMYDHLQPNETGEESSYNLNYLESHHTYSEPRSATHITDIPESDISSYGGHNVYDAYDNLKDRDLQQAFLEQSSNHPVQPKILRKPLASASVNRVSEDASLVDKGERGLTQRSRKSLLKIWWIEAVCCILVLLSVLAMAVTVYAYKDKPLPSWKYGIGISSLLAVYGVIFRASAGYVLSEGLGQLKWTLFRYPRPLHDLHVYDESARGPLGCIQLLSSFRGAQLAARLGAIATLTMLILDPFTQQLLGYKSCNVPAIGSEALETNATIPRTSAFYGNGTPLWTGYLWPEIAMQAVANAGLYGANATQVKANCNTGNCTFSSTALFNTVGYCHQCRDVTSQLTVYRNTSEITSSPAQNGTGQNKTVAHNSTLITLQQPGYGTSVNTLSVNNSVRVGYAMVSAAFRPAIDDVLYRQNYSYTFLIPASDADTLAWDFDDGGTRAFQCNLQMCVRTINASVTLGTLYEKTVAKHIDWSDVSSRANVSRSMVDLTQLNDTQKAFLSRNGYKFGANDVMIPYNGSLCPDGTVVPGNQDLSTPDPTTGDLSDQFLANIPASSIYTMSARYSDGLQQFFKQMFVGQLVGPDAEGSDQGSAVLNNLYYRGATLDTFNEAMSNIADSVTSLMRQTTIQGFSTPVTGVAYVTTTCAEPRWPWIIYVAAVAAMVIGFFFMMLVETGSGQSNWRHDFKSSALATMCAGLDQQARSSLTSALQTGDAAQLQATARNIPVYFARGDVKFVHQD